MPSCNTYARFRHLLLRCEQVTQPNSTDLYCCLNPKPNCDRKQKTMSKKAASRTQTSAEAQQSPLLHIKKSKKHSFLLINQIN